jgi:hypothetical protein
LCGRTLLFYWRLHRLNGLAYLPSPAGIDPGVFPITETEKGVTMQLTQTTQIELAEDAIATSSGFVVETQRSLGGFLVQDRIEPFRSIESALSRVLEEARGTFVFCFDKVSAERVDLRIVYTGLRDQGREDVIVIRRAGV